MKFRTFIDPNDVDVNGNYAAFLNYTRNDYDKAEIHYKCALKFDPNNVAVNGNYAAFLNYTRNDYDKAEIHYKRALKFDPNNVAVNGNYASFLTHIHKSTLIMDFCFIIVIASIV
jgi:Tfp pilus assembly protein PilF